MCGGPVALPYEEQCRQRDAIPPEARCEKCDGMGAQDVGCAIDHRIYWPCFNCGGSGKKECSISETMKKMRGRRKP